jgi:hypothetical protein
MGAWSHEPFGNDTANDWAYGLEEVNDFSNIEEALDEVLRFDEEYLDAPEAEEAIAAVEVIAKLLGQGTQSDAYTEKVDRWVQGMTSKPSPALRNKAKQALQRIVSENSELRELWEEGDEAAEWRASVDRLRSVL